MIYEIKSDTKTTVKELISNKISRNFYGFLKERDSVLKLNGSVCKGYNEINIGDILTISYEEESVTNGFDSDKELDIIFENDNFIIIDKPPHLQSIPSRANYVDSVYNRLKYYFKNTTNQILILNRLDKETKGLMLIAKNHLFRALIKDYDKEYYATTNVALNENSGVFRDSISKSKEGIKRVVDYNGDKAITHYELIDKNKGYYQYKVVLETGRTHQIRLHFSYHNSPLVGDSLYGGINNDELLLVCKKIRLVDPIENKEYEFISKYEQ